MGINAKLRAGLLALAALTGASQVSAAALSVYLDTDNNPASGCAAATSEGQVSGIERVLVAYHNGDMVTEVWQQPCVNGSFGDFAAVSSGVWPLGLGLGVGGSDVLEAWMPLDWPTSGAAGAELRLAFATRADSAAPADAALPATRLAFGAASAPAAPLSIPSLQPAALALLLTVLFLLGLGRVKRLPQGAKLTLMIGLSIGTASIVWAAFTADGQITDWTGVEPLGLDTAGDGGDYDLQAVYAKVEGDKLWVRADILMPRGGATSSAASTELGLRPQQGLCTEGYHLKHYSGNFGLFEPDTQVYSDSDYFCAPNESAAALQCGVHGAAVVIDGRASCACEAGYGGERCDQCSTGYQTATAGACEPAPAPAEILISGANEAILQGANALLTARSDTLPGPFDWTLDPASRGCLMPASGGGCESMIRGATEVLYQAPADGDILEFAVINVTQTGGGLLPAQTTIAYQKPNGMPISGAGDPALQPMLRAVADFMRYRCVGAASLGVSRYGKVIGLWGLGRTHGRATKEPLPGCGADATDPYDPAAANVKADTPFRLGSISKSVNHAIARQTIKDYWLDVAGVNATNGMIENLKLLDQFTLGARLLPDDMFDIFNRYEPTPVWFDSHLADYRWPDVTLGHLLGHTAGLRRDPESTGNSAFVNDDTTSLWKPQMRDLQTEQDFIDQEALLHADTDPATIDQARGSISQGAGIPINSIHFLPRPDHRESLKVVAGSDLESAPGDAETYSNIGPVFLTVVAEQLGGKPMVARNGEPQEHTGTLLYDFFKQQLGVETTGTSGIYRSHFVTEAEAAGLLKEPIVRNWNGIGYYPSGYDVKRPYCVWDGEECDFQNWIDNPVKRVNWGWKVGAMPLIDSRARIYSGSGLMAADPATFLRFMDNYWVSGYGASPTIGESRVSGGATIWNRDTVHNGAYDGVYSYAMQIGSDGPVTFPLPARSVNGVSLMNAFDIRHDFLLAPNSMGAISLFRDDNGYYSTKVVNVDAMVVDAGPYDITGLDRIFRGNDLSGQVEVIDTAGTTLAQIDLEHDDFMENDRLSVANIDNDPYSEIVFARPSEDKIRIYDHDGTLLSTVTDSFSSDQNPTVGNSWVYGRSNRELFYSDPTTGEIVFRFLFGANIRSFDAGLTTGDTFALADVCGKGPGKTELLIGRAATGQIEVYNYNTGDNVWDLAHSFNGGYESGGAIAASGQRQTGYSGGNQNRTDIIAVGQPSSGRVRLFSYDDPECKGEGFAQIDEFHWAGAPEFQAGARLVGGNFIDGRTVYNCVTPNGVPIAMPDGVNVFVSLNQSDDLECNSGCDDYSLLPNFIRYAACTIDWSEVDPISDQLKLAP